MSRQVTSFAEWNRHVAELVDSVDDMERLAPALIRALESITPTSLSYLGVYRKRRMPVKLWSRPGGAHPTDSAYIAGLFELDPFYLAYLQRRSGCLPLHEIAPPGFEQSEYYRRQYVNRGIADELMHMARLPAGGTAVLGCHPERKTFTAAEISRHKTASPVFTAFAQRAAELSATAEGDELHSDLDIDSALSRFGTGILTVREQEVIHLVLRGHNSESVSHQLGIALDTVKRHRMHSYEKLRVGSQGELFHKFLESIGLRPED